MKGFIKYDEYLLVEAITADYHEFSEIYTTNWYKQDAVEDLMERKDVIKESIIQINVKRCKTYYRKLHND